MVVVVVLGFVFSVRDTNLSKYGTDSDYNSYCGGKHLNSLYAFAIRHMKDKQAEIQKMNIGTSQHSKYSCDSSSNKPVENEIAITPSKYRGKKYDLTKSQQSEYNRLEKKNIMKLFEMKMKTSQGKRQWQDINVEEFVNEMYKNNDTNYQYNGNSCHDNESSLDF